MIIYWRPLCQHDILPSMEAEAELEIDNTCTGIIVFGFWAPRKNPDSK